MNTKNLIVYFSWSGNTERIAEIIKGIAGGDLLRLDLVKPYSRVYGEALKQGRKENASGDTPELAITLENLEGYDVIFIGSPNWLNAVAPPVRTFLDRYDFEGKVIMPFFTHGGGGLGRMPEEIRKACRNATVKKSLDIYGHGGTLAQAQVSDWLVELE